MRKVTAYSIVFLNQVQDRLNEGWQPWGQPLYLGGSGVVSQAMVKYEESMVQDMGPK